MNHTLTGKVQEIYDSHGDLRVQLGWTDDILKNLSDKWTTHGLKFQVVADPKSTSDNQRVEIRNINIVFESESDLSAARLLI